MSSSVHAPHPRERSLSPALLARVFHQPALIYFKMAAETLSIRECSRQLNIASSAISRQIVQLEDALGLELFHRDGRRLRLTAAGEILSRHVRRLMAPLDAAVSELDMLRGLKTGIVRIATSETIGLYFLPPLLAEYNARYPGVHLDVRVMSSSDIIEKLAEGQIDVGFAFMTRQLCGAVMTAQREVHVGALMHREHPLADAERLFIADCFHHPVAIGKPGLSFREAIQSTMERLDLLDTPYTEVGSNAMLVELAHVGHHVSIITSIGMLSQKNHDDLIFRPFADEDLPPHFFGVMVRTIEGLHFAPASFHSHAVHYVNQLA